MSFLVDETEWDNEDRIELYLSLDEHRKLVVRIRTSSFTAHPNGLSLTAYAKMYGYGIDFPDHEIHMDVSVQATSFVFSNMWIYPRNEWEDEIWPVLEKDWGITRKSHITMEYPSPHIGQSIHTEAYFRTSEAFFIKSKADHPFNIPFS